MITKKSEGRIKRWYSRIIFTILAFDVLWDIAMHNLAFAGVCVFFASLFLGNTGWVSLHHRQRLVVRVGRRAIYRGEGAVLCHGVVTYGLITWLPPWVTNVLPLWFWTYERERWVPIWEPLSIVVGSNVITVLPEPGARL